MRPAIFVVLSTAALGAAALFAQAQRAVVLHAARLVEVETGRELPARFASKATALPKLDLLFQHPPGAEVIVLGNVTLLPGLIDAHVHLFLHPGAEDLQTVQESVPQRTIVAVLAARDDLMAGFTAERDMGTEGAGSADSAVRDASRSCAECVLVFAVIFALRPQRLAAQNQRSEG